MVGAIVSPLYLTNLPRSEFEDCAAGFILSSLDDAIQSGGGASLFLSGGSTPGPIYEKLSETNFLWNSVSVGLVDERWVPETDTGSNAALIRRTLLQNEMKKTRFTPMKNSSRTTELGQPQAEENYQALFKSPAVAVLGMGTDGHVCSWFPDAKGVETAFDTQNLSVVQAITAKPSKVTGAYLDRMTLTLSALARCQKILLLISGSEKRAVLGRAMQSGDKTLPVTHLLALAASKPDNPLTILHTDNLK